jgi:CubicO group peptidase (beta-lactamase class C family)
MKNELWLCAIACVSVVATALAGDGVDSARLQTAISKLDTLANGTLQSTGVPGIAIAIVHAEEVVFSKGFGVRAAGMSEKIDADTVFQVASVSKPISSTVLSILVGEGKVDWDDRVVDHDAGFRLHEPFVTDEVRLRDLLCHRSGLPDHCGDLLEDMGYSRAEILRRMRFQPLSGFRNEYAYTNFGYSEACYAAAKANGQDWSELAAEKLFQPLGMKSTSYRFADYDRAANKALLHVRVDGKWVARNTRQPDAQAPAGGVSSTLNDITKWLMLLVNDGKFGERQLITPAALAETRTPQIVTGFTPDEGRVVSYGLGWIVSVERGGRVFWKHSGGFSLGMRTEVAVLPKEKLAIAVFSNAGPTGIPEAMVESFFDWVLDGKLQRDWVEFANRMFDEEAKRELGSQRDYTHPPSKPSPALPLAAYTGSYANEFFGKIEVVEVQGALVLRMGPKPIEAKVDHWDRDTFTYQPVGEMAGGRSGVQFSIDPSARADGILIENLNVHGQGRFARQN